MEPKEMTRRVRLARWVGIVRERKESGSSVRTWCRENGINEKTYYYWQKKLREAACAQLQETEGSNTTSMVATGFAEVRQEERLPGSALSPLVPATPKTLPEAPSHLRVEIDGIRISVGEAYPPEKLAALLRELIRPC